MNSFFPDLNPLVDQIKQFNLNQQKTNQLLQEILNAINSKSESR